MIVEQLEILALKEVLMFLRYSIAKKLPANLKWGMRCHQMWAATFSIFAEFNQTLTLIC